MQNLKCQCNVFVTDLYNFYLCFVILLCDFYIFGFLFLINLFANSLIF
ncbi:hypothetical protein BBU94A_I10 (plasmid) [Borreliella burgdorferi 94a]|nr:hypothetical protein BBU72A_I0013 [Borreliella burgdorferi 72a]ACN92081.1 hypothetical protein BBU94A_I10 [Borreliella burgdorferi 94a]